MVGLFRGRRRLGLEPGTWIFEENTPVLEVAKRCEARKARSDSPSGPSIENTSALVGVFLCGVLRAYTDDMLRLLESWRYERFHVSYLLGWLAVGLLLGLSLGRWFSVDDGAVVVCGALTLLLGGFRSQRWWAVVAILIAGMLLGGLRASGVAQQYSLYASFVGSKVTLRGVMSGDAQVVGSGKQRVTLGHVQVGERSLPGEVFVSVIDSRELKRGDVLEVVGELREPFASYGATVSAAKVVSVERHRNVIRDVRERFSDSVRRYVLEPMASLGLGFVVGQRSTLPATLDEQLKVVGLTHIVVASGYNLTILVRFAMRLLSRHSRYLALVGSLVLIMLFVSFSGFSPSMNRAVIVTTLALLAWYVGRRFHPLLLLFYVAAGTALWNPMYVWSDLGWYLSFFAFAGVLIVSPLVIRFLYRRRDPSAFEQLVFETMSAEVMALPIIAFAFGVVPVFGLVANVLVGPFIPAAMVLVVVAGLCGMLLPAIASIAALPAMILIAYMVSVVEWLGGFGFAQLQVNIVLIALFVWYFAVALMAIWAQRRVTYDFRQHDSQIEI